MNMRNEKWLIVGADGLIGKELLNLLNSSGNAALGTVFLEKPDLVRTFFLDLSGDISDWEASEHTTIAVLCAAVTSQEECRRNPEAAREINCIKTVELARKFVERGVFVIFPSTNLVFDGREALNREDDPVSPRTEYARQKAETERGLLALGTSVSIVRFSKIVWPEMPLLKGWMKALESGESIQSFSDLRLSPIPLSFAVKALEEIGRKRLNGIIHVSGRKDITYSEMAYRIAELLGADRNLVRPVRARESGQNIEWLPAHTTLNSTRFEKETGIMIPDVWETIEEVVRA